MITFFTIPKPFNGIYDIIQRNAILSWQQLSARCEILIFGDDPSVVNFAEDLGLECINTFQTNDYGTPLLDGIWDSAKINASSNIICYINSDIILFPDFANMVQTVHLKEFFLAGRRWDIAIDSLIDFNSDWVPTLKQMIEEQGVLHRETGVDYFIFPKIVMPVMPAFAIGRGWWDNWLIYYFKQCGIPVIDGTNIMTVHQNHDYSHIKSIAKGTSNKGLERTQNQIIANLKFCDILYISDASHYYLNGQIYKTPLSQKLIRKYYRFIRPKLQKFKAIFTKGHSIR